MYLWLLYTKPFYSEIVTTTPATTTTPQPGGWYIISCLSSVLLFMLFYETNNNGKTEGKRQKIAEKIFLQDRSLKYNKLDLHLSCLPTTHHQFKDWSFYFSPVCALARTRAVSTQSMRFYVLFLGDFFILMTL